MVFNGPSPLPQENFEHFDGAKNEKKEYISNLFTHLGRLRHVECIIINSCRHQKYLGSLRTYFYQFLSIPFRRLYSGRRCEMWKNDKRTNREKMYRKMGVECSRWLAYDVIDVDVSNARRETLCMDCSRCALTISYHRLHWLWILVNIPGYRSLSCGDAEEDDGEVLHIERIVHSSYLIMRSKFMCVHFTCNSLEVFAG